ncbi:UvrB/UvrC motif-containing protein [Agathobaculum sp.]|uniref:UvrB/UvrC motif-containing protein n=1 Tax=Agathobaculum sp. TaxID=2048138 RepID=UPI002A80CE05|nr:UvrB/UvrC motif-containing protein [Agathobaculum sp.]MDY3617767.1 UvrB/UvrC motif-containing protein [Agathobaculum sp.]
MKCEKCGKNEATTFFSENINGQKRELHLCGECAKEMNLGSAFENAFQSFGHLWSDPFHSFLGGGFGSLFPDTLGAPTASMLGTERKCPSCGMNERELRQSGRVGCPDCYTAFADILNPYVQKVHGATRHIGAAPAAAEEPQQDPVAALRAQLQEAVASEDYEQAARLRDEIHRLEGEAK